MIAFNFNPDEIPTAGRLVSQSVVCYPSASISLHGLENRSGWILAQQMHFVLCFTYYQFCKCLINVNIPVRVVQPCKHVTRQVSRAMEPAFLPELMLILTVHQSGSYPKVISSPCLIKQNINGFNHGMCSIVQLNGLMFHRFQIVHSVVMQVERQEHFRQF